MRNNCTTLHTPRAAATCTECEAVVVVVAGPHTRAADHTAGLGRASCAHTGRSRPIAHDQGAAVGGVNIKLSPGYLDDELANLTWFAMAALGLGFFWIAFERERQSWHGKIAGTVVVRVPKGVSLL